MNGFYAGILNRAILDLFAYNINFKLDSIFWFFKGYGEVTLEETLHELNFDYENLKQILKDRFDFDIDKELETVKKVGKESKDDKEFFDTLKKIYKKKKFKNEYSRNLAPTPQKDHYNPNLFSPDWDYLLSKNEFKYNEIAKAIGCSSQVVSKMLANKVFSYKWVQPYRGRPYKVVSRFHLFNFLTALGFEHLPEMEWKELPDDDFDIDKSKIPDKNALSIDEVAKVLNTYKGKLIKLIYQNKFPGGNTLNQRSSKISLFVTKKALLKWIEEYERRKKNES